MAKKLSLKEALVKFRTHPNYEKEMQRYDVKKKRKKKKKK